MPAEQGGSSCRMWLPSRSYWMVIRCSISSAWAAPTRPAMFRRAGAAVTGVSTGFAPRRDRAGLQAICGRRGPAEIQAFFGRWLSRLPVPLTAADRAAGYWWELSMRQVETSRTMVFDAPRQARAFFEALIADNLDLGRPEHVEILFKRDPRGRKPKDQAGGTFRTAIDRNSQGVTKSTTASCARSWPPTSPRTRPRSPTPCAPSTPKL